MPNRDKQLRDLVRAFQFYDSHLELESGSVEALRAHQARRLKNLVRRAMAHSPFYAEYYRGIDPSGEIRLQDLPVVNKRLMMENFDSWVTNPRLKLDEIERQIETDPESPYYLGRYRIVATSGSSGLRGIFVYDRREWQKVLAGAFRWARVFDDSPLRLSSKKFVSIIANKPTHATTRLCQSLQPALGNLRLIDATLPLDEIVEELNAFQPDYLTGYASLISLLAVEQIEGRLAIAPEKIATFSEVLGADRIARAREAWGLTPFNHYGAAEQVTIAADCEAHSGLHLYEDMSIVEVVDVHNNPVPPGTPGHKILLTNLYKFVQPLIRYEITDIVTEEPDSCACGQPFRRLSEIGGRARDIVTLPAKAGSTVSISPMVLFDCMIGFADVTEYQYGVSGASLIVKVVPRRGADLTRLSGALRAALTQALDRHGATGFIIGIEFSDSFVRSGETMGKLKLTAPPVA